jgi:hypothetical protein
LSSNLSWKKLDRCAEIASMDIVTKEWLKSGLVEGVTTWVSSGFTPSRKGKIYSKYICIHLSEISRRLLIFSK